MDNTNLPVLGLLAVALQLGMAKAVPVDTHTWVGGHSSRWSDSPNWIGGAPRPSETRPVDLLIPGSASAHRELTNDVPGLIIRTLTIAAHANTLHVASGVVMKLQNATLAGLGNNTILASSFRLQAEGYTRIRGSNSFIVRGPITEVAPGATLEVSGNVSLEAPSTHSGPTLLSAGAINISGTMTNTAFIQIATNAALDLAADVTVLTNLGTLRIAPEARSRPDTSRLFGRGLVCGPDSIIEVAMIDYPALDSIGPEDGGRLHSHLVMDGLVALAGRLEATTDLFQEGLRFVIIENTGTSPTLGQFQGLPEGALVTMPFHSLLVRISYRGGDGNDVTLTLVEPPVGRRLAGPWHLENGWFQILGSTAEFEEGLPHRWEASADVANPAGWMPLSPEFIPAEAGTLLTLTNTAAFPRRFYRLAVP